MKFLNISTALIATGLYAAGPALYKITELVCSVPRILYRGAATPCGNPAAELLKLATEYDPSMLKAVLSDSPGITVNVPTAVITMDALPPTIRAGRSN